MKQYKTEGIILKRRNYGEADRLLTVLTKKSGKIVIKAVGVRKITSRRSPHIEPLNVSVLSLYKGRGFPILTEAQTLESYSVLKDNLIKIGYGYYLCELVDGFCAENQENRRVFFLLRQTLDRLCWEKQVSSLIHDFELSLLSILGFYRRFETISQLNTEAFIERILERKLKTPQLLPRLS